jgi:hypothetical protein
MPWPIPKHPVAMRTIFRHCFLVNFAVEPDWMRSLLPEYVEPELHDGKAYLSIVIADMEKMRPALLPRCFGVSYTQVVYRVVVRCAGGRGVYFLRSDADSRPMCLAGNWLTFFRFTYSPVRWRSEPGRLHFDLSAPGGDHADIRASFVVGRALGEMPNTSHFRSLADAQPFLVELYAAYSPAERHINRVRIRRGPWRIQIVADERQGYDHLCGSAAFPRGTAALDSVFYVRDLPYHWFPREKLPLPRRGLRTTGSGRDGAVELEVAS